MSLLILGPIKGIGNLNINDVATEIEVDNVSDDDVIEVVRDEAPIEILSDGEELELQRAKQNKMLDSIVDNFHFTSLPADPQPEVNIHDNQRNNLVDPLTNSVSFTSDLLSSFSLPPFNDIAPVHSTTDTGDDNKSNQDESDENHYVNVTDLDQPESWSKLVSNLNQIGCGECDENKTQQKIDPPPAEDDKQEQIEPQVDVENVIVNNPATDDKLTDNLSAETQVHNPEIRMPASDNLDSPQVPEYKSVDNVNESA